MFKTILFGKFAETTEAVIIRGTTKIGFVPTYYGGITIFSETFVNYNTNEEEYYIRILVTKSELTDASALDLVTKSELTDASALDYDEIAIAIIDYDEIDPLIEGIACMYRMYRQHVNEDELEGDYTETFYQTKTLGISMRGSTIDTYVDVTFHIENAMVTFDLSTIIIVTSQLSDFLSAFEALLIKAKKKIDAVK